MADRQVEECEQALIDAWARSLGTVADFQALCHAYRDAVLAQADVGSEDLASECWDSKYPGVLSPLPLAWRPFLVPSDPGW